MVEQIAKTAHAVHRAYCIENNIPTQPEWHEVDNEHKDVVYNSIRSILHGAVNTAEESHNKFLESKLSQGWRFGEEYSASEKLNPRLVPFKQLTLEQRTKEGIFFACVSSFCDTTN